jgi:hypothetical protein
MLIEPNRAPMPMPPQMYKTYMIRRPLTTHWRRATCAEVECPRYLRGWKSVLDLSGQDGQNAAAWIRHMSGLRFTESVTGPHQVTFLFPAGQLCARSGRHRLPLEREPIMLMRHGDHRGNPDSVSRLFSKPEDWRDDFGEHLERKHEDWKKGAEADG